MIWLEYWALKLCLLGRLVMHILLPYLLKETLSSTVSRRVFPELLYLVGVSIISHPLEKICPRPVPTVEVQFLPQNFRGRSGLDDPFETTDSRIQLGF